MCSVLAKPILTDHPVDVGHRSEAAVFGALVERGYRILLPFGVNQRYDMVLDNDGELLKAQIKTGRLRNGVIEFSAVSTQSNMNRTDGSTTRGKWTSSSSIAETTGRPT